MLSISVSAVLFVTAMISTVHAFVPLSTTHNKKIRGGRCTVANHIKQQSPLLPSTTTYPCTTSTTTSLLAHTPLQPGKGGIIVEAKSNFIARDVLIDSMMGRGDGLPSDSNTMVQEKDEFEDFSSNEDSWLSSSNSLSAAQPANRRGSSRPMGSMGQQSVGNNRQNNRPSNKAGMSREQMVQQLNSGQQFTQQQQPPQAPPPSNQPQTPLLDPSQLKISQIQSELNTYSISYDDCFDRTSLEKKLREVRLVMGVASTMDGDSRRNQQQGEGGGIEERGFNLDNLQQSTPIQQSPPPIQPPPTIQPPPQQNSFGNSGTGSSSFSPPQGAFNTGGVSIKGDSSILSSSGFVSGDGNVFSTGPPGQPQSPPGQPQSPPIQQPPLPQQPPSNPISGPSIEELINQQNKVRAAKSSRTSPAEQAIFTSSVTNTFSNANKKRSPPPPPRRQQPPSSNNNSNVRTSISSGYRDNTRPLQPMPKTAASGSSGSSVGNVSGGGSTSTFTSGGQQSAPSPPRPPPQQQTKSTTSARNTNSVQQTPTRPTPGNASTGNPFSSNNRRASTQGAVGNSFRDSAHGIGFGDVNSYTSTNSRPTPGNASSGNPSRRSSSSTRDNTAGQPSGDGVRLGKSRTSYGDFNSGSSIGGDFGSNSSGGSSAPQQSNIGGSSASFRNGNASPPPPRSNTAPSQQIGGPSGRKNSSVSGGGGTSTFSSSSSSPSTPISNFGSSDFGPASSMNAGGVSIKGDSSILSSFGQVGGQGGSTNVFSSGQAAAPPQAPPPQNVNVPPPQQQPYDPTPPMEEPQLDWLTQDSSVGGGGNSYIPTSPDSPSVTSDYDDMYSQQLTTSSYNGKRISELYQEQGLDIFSGNQDGFGAVQGVENAGGDVSYRGSADDVKVQGKVGDMGATMGGDFGGSSGGSARYSQGRGYTDMGSDDDV